MTGLCSHLSDDMIRVDGEDPPVGHCPDRQGIVEINEFGHHVRAREVRVNGLDRENRLDDSGVAITSAQHDDRPFRSRSTRWSTALAMMPMSDPARKMPDSVTTNAMIRVGHSVSLANVPVSSVRNTLCQKSSGREPFKLPPNVASIRLSTTAPR